jgi:methylenetetrahydrofolate--tRNA-(uracil-5-)-methyltransferase
MDNKKPVAVIIGGGLAGCEAAWQAAQRGLQVNLFEMRPLVKTGAHITNKLAELICSNSLGSNVLNRPSGLLKEELRLLGSLLVECAEKTALPAGGALAVDREAFANLVTEHITHHPNIQLIREEVIEIPEQPTIICSGPLTSPSLAAALKRITGQENLFFYDAIAPIVNFASINMNVAFRASRHNLGDQEQGDYINCPFNEEEYDVFVNALTTAHQITLREFEEEIPQGVTAGKSHFFEGCLPIEVIANRGHHTLAFGPMRPIGLKDPRNGNHPHAVVQLRQDNLAGSLYNLVGFQTNLTFPEQQRVLHMIPGLENAEFIRYGQMHRNTYITSPLLLEPTLQFKNRQDLFLAGQIIGVEGYMGNIATGLLAGINLVNLIKGTPLLEFPDTTMLGALCKYITHAAADNFQPMKANFGLFPPLKENKMRKVERARDYSIRALEDLRSFIQSNPTSFKLNQDSFNYAET